MLMQIVCVYLNVYRNLKKIADANGNPNETGEAEAMLMLHPVSLKITLSWSEANLNKIKIYCILHMQGNYIH